MPYVRPTPVTCHMSDPHRSHATCQTHTWHMSHVRPTPVTCIMSHVTCHMSHVTCIMSDPHMSHVRTTPMSTCLTFWTKGHKARKGESHYIYCQANYCNFCLLIKLKKIYSFNIRNANKTTKMYPRCLTRFNSLTLIQFMC